MQGLRRELVCLLLTAAVSSLCSGCLRFGYGSHRAGDDPPDAGAFDAGASYSGAGSGGGAGNQALAGAGAGAGGQSGRAGFSGAGGTSAAGRGGSAGAVSNAGSVADAGATALDGGVNSPADAGATPPDAAAADSGLTSYDGCLSRPGVMFCDGFEQADLSFQHWSYQTRTNGALNRSETHAHTGTWSMRVTTTQGTGTQARQATSVLDHLSSGEVWLRFYNWIPSSIQATSSFSLGIVGEAEIPYDGFELRVLPSDVDLNTTGAGYVPSIRATPFPRDRWVCVELHVIIDPVLGRYEGYLDSALVAQSPEVNTVPTMGYTVAEVGVHYAPPNQPAVELFVDDVYVGQQRIPCD